MSYDIGDYTTLPIDAMPPAVRGRQDSKWLSFLPQLTEDTAIVIRCMDKERMNQIRSNIQGSFRQARKVKHGMNFNLRTRGLQEGAYWNLYVWKEEAAIHLTYQTDDKGMIIR